MADDIKIEGIIYNLTDDLVNVYSYEESQILPYSTILNQVTIGGLVYSVTYIDNNAFESCSALISITIPNSITSIGTSAFLSCSYLTSIEIPNSVTYIGDNVFNGCSSLTSITIPDLVTSVGNYTFIRCSKLSSINIPSLVTSIGGYAFYDCSALTSATIGNSVTSIGDYAFYLCSALTSITIPDSVTYIGEYAFYDCSALTSATIGNSVTSIGESAFDSCSALTSIFFLNQNNLGSTQGTNIFSGTGNITSVTFYNTVNEILSLGAQELKIQIDTYNTGVNYYYIPPTPPTPQPTPTSNKFNFGLFVRGKGGNHKIAAATINLGSTKGRGSSTRIFNNCNKKNSYQSCINQFITIR